MLVMLSLYHLTSELLEVVIKIPKFIEVKRIQFPEFLKAFIQNFGHQIITASIIFKKKGDRLIQEKNTT